MSGLLRGEPSLRTGYSEGKVSTSRGAPRGADARWLSANPGWFSRATIPNSAGCLVTIMRTDGQVVEDEVVMRDEDRFHYLRNTHIREVHAWKPRKKT